MHPETNPHFLPRQRQTRPIDTPHPQIQPISPISQQPRPHHQIQRPQPPPLAPVPVPVSAPVPTPRTQTQVTFAPLPQHTQPQPQHDPVRTPTSGLVVKRPSKTNPIIWFIGAFCALLWIIVIIGVIIVLIVYFVFRPRSPKFDISAASLNAAYLDVGYLLNADVTILANFTNPSKKATVDFHYGVVSLYYKDTLIASSYVNPVLSMKAQSNFRTVHLETSQVMLSLIDRERMKWEMVNNRLRFEVKGQFRVRSNLGNVLHYSYELFGHCTIDLTNAPSGVMVYKKCRTHR
ncbi:NDR1/HIN1-like protein 6 [Impatiens glandulifera]|uniref:NDR1/HIN1-like protein 6 n=1 Tax=Impatiens glandulifera TaxID=253017 RepID=UPI001FB17C82|nr:NDR1/HIN1-like protein 6 [Impatiens glandulifera]